MIPVSAALKAMQQAVRNGQIGTPVAARVTACVASDHGVLERLAARLLVACSDWLNDSPARISVAGDVSQGQLSLLVPMSRGGSTLISVGTSTQCESLFEAMAIGQNGIASWEADPAEVRLAANEAELSEAEQRCWQMIREVGRALLPVASSKKQNQDGQECPSYKPPFGVLLVSGHHTHQPNYAQALAADQRCKLIAVTDEKDVAPRRRELNERLASNLKVPYLPDVYAAVRRDDVQIVSFCAEPERRGRIIVAAAEAGKALYLDKPLAGSVRDANAIVAAVRKHRVPSHMFSLVPSDLAVRARESLQKLKSETLKAIHIDLTFAKGHTGAAKLGQPRRESAEPTAFELPDAKRELTNIGVYGVVFVLWLTQRSVRRVTATTGNYFFSEHQQRDFEDFGQMLLELDNGVIATISCGRTGWRSSPGSGVQRITLVGSQSATTIDAARPRIEVWSDTEAWTAPARNPDDPMAMWFLPLSSPFTAKSKPVWTIPALGAKSDAAYFLDCLESGRPSEVPASLAAMATNVLFAAYRSAATGRAVDLA